MSRRVALTLTLALLGGLPAVARAQAQPVDPAVGRAVQFLRGHVGADQTGETALAALALVKADVPENDPALAAAINKVRQRFNGTTYTPERVGGSDIYEASVILLALANLDPVGYKAEIAAAARHLLSKQKSNGAWDYDGRNTPRTGDTSISQYATLGLWEAENAGVNVPPRTWDRAASWFLSTQLADGGWCYHRDEGQPPTVSMTAAGVGSLLICKRQLQARRNTGDKSRLLQALVGDAEKEDYESQVSFGRIDAGVRAGLNWIGANFTLEGTRVGHSPYYGLYGIERLAALADKATIGRVDWFEVGRGALARTQQGDGAWNAEYGNTANTAWGILFLTRSTAQTLRKIEVKRLGSGTLLGGRGLPNDLSHLTVSQGRVIVRPMNGAVDDMLDVLADPRADDADAALAGLVARYRARGPEALRPFKPRLRKLLADPDPGVRRVAAWALGRTADLDVAPALIGALTDPNDEVVGEARTALQVISRKIEGYGPAPGASPDQRAEAAARWKVWYQSARPPDLDRPDDGLTESEVEPATASNPGR